MKRLFIGGPVNGRIITLPDGRIPSWKVAVPGGGVFVYNAQRFAVGTSAVTVYAFGAVTSEMVFQALLAAAGLEADR